MKRAAGTMAVVLLVATATAESAAERLEPARAARLAEAERALAQERWEDAQGILDELAGGLEVEQAVLAARLDLALRRAGLAGTTGTAGVVPPAVTSAAAALERRNGLGHRACLLLADEAVASGNLDTAARWLGEALEAVPDDDATRLRLALLDMERGKPEDAATLALALLERQPRCAGILQLAGQALVATDRAADALPVLERLVELDPDNAEAHSLLGTALLVERRMDEAIDQLRRAVAIAATPARVANLGIALSYAGRSDEAVALLGQLTTDHPDDGGAWINYAVALASAGRLDDARAALAHALELDAHDARALGVLQDLDALMHKP